jgi:hypothetical protein
MSMLEQQEGNRGWKDELILTYLDKPRVSLSGVHSQTAHASLMFL